MGQHDDIVNLINGLSLDTGSDSYTSRPAPAIFFAVSARTKAASSITLPREVLIMNAVGFMCSECMVIHHMHGGFVQVGMQGT